MLTMNGTRDDVQKAFCHLAAITTDGPNAPASWMGAISIPPAWVRDFTNHVCVGVGRVLEGEALDEPPFDPVQAWRSRTRLLGRFVTPLNQPCVSPDNRADMALIARLVNEMMRTQATTNNPLVHPERGLGIRRLVERRWQPGRSVGLSAMMQRAANPLARMSRAQGMHAYGTRLREEGMTVYGVGNRV